MLRKGLQEGCQMSEGLWPVLLIITIVVFYTIVKIREYMRQSDQQWKNVDKSKLREWDDEDDWKS